MTDLASFDIPFSDIEKQVMDWVREAIELRFRTAGDPDGSLSTGHEGTPSEALAFLRRVRQRTDRVDELRIAAIRAKGRARRAQAEAAFQADNALSTAMADRSARRADFSSGRERESEAKLDSFEERRAAHQAARLVDVTSDAYEVINGIHWQLDAIRKDLRATLNALQFEATLER